MRMTVAGTGWLLRPSLMEDFNTETAQAEHDLAEYDEEYNHDGTLVQVHTPWAMGLVDKQGVSLV